MGRVACRNKIHSPDGLI